MTTEYPYSLAQLAQILSALENERRNPNTKRNAIKAIERQAAQIGLTAEDVFAAADGLLSGRMSAAEFRAALCRPTSFMTEPPADTSTKELGGDAAEDVPSDSVAVDAGQVVEAPVQANEDAGDDLDVPAFLRREAEAEATLQPDRQCLMPSRNSKRTRSKRMHNADLPTEAPARKHRDGTKEALVIEMLRRPDGATIAQIMHETGWQAHTVRGAFAGALKKKRGLTVISAKPEGGERVYRIAG